MSEGWIGISLAEKQMSIQSWGISTYKGQDTLQEWKVESCQSERIEEEMRSYGESNLWGLGHFLCGYKNPRL